MPGKGYQVSVMEILTNSHYESMFSITALVYRRSHMCRLECNVRMCAEELLPEDSPLDIQAAHSLVWLSLVYLFGSYSCPGHLWEAAVVWASATNSAVYICVYWLN